jgi:hypothetical protein
MCGFKTGESQDSPVLTLWIIIGMSRQLLLASGALDYPLFGAEADLTIVLNLVTIPLHMLGQTICTIR